jgi:cell division protein FtsL
MRNAQQLILAYAQAPWRKQTQFIGLFLLGLVFIALVASLNLIVSAQAATYGREIQGIQAEIKKTQRMNADLESQLAELLSADNLEERAKEFGLSPANPEQIIYLEVEGYIPRQPANLAPPSKPAAAPSPGMSPEFSQPLFTWVKDQIFKVEITQWISEVTTR